MTLDDKMAAFQAVGEEILKNCGKQGLFTIIALKDRGFRVHIEILGGRKTGYAFDNRTTLKEFEKHFEASLNKLIR